MRFHFHRWDGWFQTRFADWTGLRSSRTRRCRKCGVEQTEEVVS